MNQLRGIVMCGGQSLRMGRDKGLIPIQHTCWAGYVAGKLEEFDLPVNISINPSQIATYRSLFPAEKLIIDSQDIEGPLNGLLSCHDQYPDDDLLLVACDMIDIQTETIQSLISAYKFADHKYDYYAFQNHDNFEPFCAIYSAQALKNIKAEQSNLSGWGLQRLIRNGDTLIMQINDSSSFNNHNQLM